MAACTRSDEPETVVVKEIVGSLDFDNLAKCRHPNLVRLLAYEYEKMTLVVMEYTVTSLEQVMATDLKLEEIHVSTVCSQVCASLSVKVPTKLYRYSRACNICLN